MGNKYKPKVLIVENSLDFTGALNSAMRSSELLKDHFEFSFLFPAGSNASRFAREKGFVVYEIPMQEIRRSVSAMLTYIPVLIMNAVRLIRLLKSAKVDLLVSNDFYNMILPVYRIAGGDIPYVCYVRFRPSKFPRILVRIWWWLHKRYAASIIAVSEAVRKELPTTSGVSVIYNEFPNLTVEFSAPDSEMILYPANYIQGKGHELALQAFAPLHVKYPLWKLRFVGGDMGLAKNKAYREDLKKQSVALNLQDAVEWCGFSEQIDDEYRAASIVLNFSASESFSLTCLEAMFHGRPVIATRSGGPQDIIEDGKTGMLVDVGDVPSMTASLERLITDPGERNTIAQNAFHQVRSRFSLEELMRRVLLVYTGAMKAK